MLPPFLLLKVTKVQIVSKMNILLPKQIKGISPGTVTSRTPSNALTFRICTNIADTMIKPSTNENVRQCVLYFGIATNVYLRKLPISSVMLIGNTRNCLLRNSRNLHDITRGSSDGVTFELDVVCIHIRTGNSLSTYIFKELRYP